MNDRQRLEAILDVVCRYLPPDGISREDAMNQIIALVDPMPPRREWIGLTDEDTANICMQGDLNDWHDEQVIDAVEAKLKEKNCG